MDVLAIVKSKLPDTQLSDNDISIRIEEVAESIKSYCNRRDIPRELKFVHANMVVDFITGERKKLSPEDHSVISDIKEGDVSISFDGTQINLGEKITEDIIYNYKAQLNKHRKLRW